MILINGCSFTAEGGYATTWVNGIRDNGYSVINVAAGGASNTMIRRKVYHYLFNNIYNIESEYHIDYAIIQWSTIDRWDYPVLVDYEKSKMFPRVSSYPERLNTINYMCNGTDTLGYAKDFYERYYSVYGAVLETLENIYHTQQYLKTANVPYKMITIGNIFGMDVTIDKLNYLQSGNINGNYNELKVGSIFSMLEKYDSSWYELDIIKPLLQKIDFSKFIFTDDTNISGFGGGIIEWFANKNEILVGGGGHPSEEQHSRFFKEFLWDKIKNELYAIT
jgi:hypothetical protein